MAANEIKILIGGDAEGLDQAAKKSVSAIQILQNQLARLGKLISQPNLTLSQYQRLGDLINKTKREQDALNKAINTFGTGKLVAGANQATNALTNLSRIAQDAPFGFIGITNNINPLLESFQRLKAETGSTSGALKALGSSLLGAGGLGLFVGIGSALLTVFGDKLFGLGAASKKAKEDADELAKAIRNINDIQGEAIAGVQGQIAQVNSLAGAITDSNRPYEERRRALEQLRGINKAYFGDLQLEDAATGKLAATVAEYNKALVAQAVVKGFLDEIVTVSKAAANAESELAKANTKLAQSRQALLTAQSNSRPSGREGTAQTFEEARANETVLEAIKAQRSERDKLLQLDEQRALLFNRLNNAQLEALKYKTLETKGSEKEVDLLSKRLAALEKIKDATRDLSVVADLEEQIFDLKVKITLRDAAKNGLSKEETDLAIKGFRDQLTAAFNKEALSFEAIPKVKVTNVELAPLPSIDIESKIAKAAGLDKNIPIESDRQVKIRLQGLDFVLAQEDAARAVERLRETVLNGVTDTLSTSASAFGELIAGAFSGEGIGKSLANAAQTLLSGIGGVLQEIGKQVIATSTLVKLLKESLKTLFANPVAGIAVGLGLVALGGLLKSIKIPGFASGVNNFSGGLAIVGERGPELVNLPRGSDVIPNHLLGGSNVNVTLIPSLQYSGDGFRIMMQRVDERRRRLG